MLSNSPNEPSRINLESTVIIDEIGHLLILVNLGSKMQTEHLDETHQKHCVMKNCLIFWQTNKKWNFRNVNWRKCSKI